MQRLITALLVLILSGCGLTGPYNPCDDDIHSDIDRNGSPTTITADASSTTVTWFNEVRVYTVTTNGFACSTRTIKTTGE